MGTSTIGPTFEKMLEEIPTRLEETRRWLESGLSPTNVVAGPSGGAALEELTKMVRDLQIAQARRGDEGQPCDWR